LHKNSPLDRYNLHRSSAYLTLEGVEPNKSVIT